MNADPEHDARPLAMWCTPRSLSHAFEKMIRARGDHVVFAEPFSDAFYFGPERQSARTWLPQNLPDTYMGQLQKILDARRSSRVYVRAMPYQLGRYFTRDFFGHFTSGVQTRDPAYALPSLFKCRPDFSELEAGYSELHATWKLLCDMHGVDRVPVVDGVALQTDPARVVGEWCDAIGINRDTQALSWPKGSDSSWDGWKEWTDTVRDSIGFHPPPKELPAVPNEYVAKMIDACSVYYREMAVHKI